jgi:hypothetical protein
VVVMVGAGGRTRVCIDLLRVSGFELTTLLDGHAVLVAIGGSGVRPEVRLGEATIRNTSAAIDHDCAVGRDVHVAPPSAVAGGGAVVTDLSEAVTAVGRPARMLPGRTGG